VCLQHRTTIISVLARLRFRADFLAWILKSLRRSARLKHRDAGAGEIYPALTMGDQHPVRKEEVRAQKHRPQPHLSLQTATGLTVRYVLPQVGKTDLGILDRFIADSEALEWTDPGIDCLCAEPAGGARDDARRLRRYAQLGGIGRGQH
jgi:hypothetical protein